MNFSSPAFWASPHTGWLARLLSPFSLVTHCVYRMRVARTSPMVIGIPVFCCGNLTVGGTGKTIVTLDLVARLKALGHQPHILSRGYKGRLKGPVRVDATRMSARDTGDEPFMMAQHAPVWIGADRRLTATLAREAGADCLIMDDGLQNPGLHKTRKFVIFDGATGLGNRQMLPAGPLRQPWRIGLKEADALIVIGTDVTHLIQTFPADKKIWRAHLCPHPELETLRDKPVIAFAGIGRPKKFFDMLRRSGLNVVREFSFADHHRYNAQDFDMLLTLAQNRTVQLVTTEKDFVKLPAQLKAIVRMVRVSLLWEKPGAVDDDLARAWDDLT